MNLLQLFRDVLTSMGVDADQKILVAVSGGLDSVVLLHLSAKAGLNVSAAHINFKLRGNESDADERFVQELCTKLKVPVFTKNLPIDKSLVKDGVQAEARKLRYDWFDSMMKTQGFDFLFTAHHQDDLIETFFINLQRGAGLKGLKSIPMRNGYIMRPLLHFPKGALQTYAISEHITWRQDLSNETDDYLRNRVRHGLAKEFEKIAPEANENAAKSIQYLAEADEWLKKSAQDFIEMNTEHQTDESFRISIHAAKQLWTFPALGKYVTDAWDFEPDQLTSLQNLAQGQSGKMLIGKRYRVFRDRDFFVFATSATRSIEAIQIHEPTGAFKEPLNLSWKLENFSENLDTSNTKKAFLDIQKLHFPLTLRIWESGDRFVPYGMAGSKKISDYLTDLKLSVPEKERVYVLLSGKDICWVVGFRTDDRFKVDAQTTQMISLQLHR